jgi:hypothetical protein
VTALLEDRYNKTGHMREEARRAAERYAQKLRQIGRVVHPGFFESESEAVQAARLLAAEAAYGRLNGVLRRVAGMLGIGQVTV